ncbi:MAG: hypothetical protein AAGC55_00750, partial [Myxococcota bacterium]
MNHDDSPHRILPLTADQLRALSMLQAQPQGLAGRCAAVAALPSDWSQHRLDDRLCRAVGLHPIFRLRVASGGAQAWLDCDERSGASAAESRPAAIDIVYCTDAADAQHHVERPFDLQRGPVVRAVFADGAQPHVIAVAPRAVADEHSLRVVLDTALGAAGSDGNLTVPIPDTLLVRAIERQSARSEIAPAWAQQLDQQHSAFDLPALHRPAQRT